MKPEVFITGANGEIGQSLVNHLAAEGSYSIVALDLSEPAAALAEKCSVFYRGNILDHSLLASIETKHRFKVIFHLAGLLSSMGEKNPKLAHQVNVDGSINTLQIAQNHSRETGQPVVFVFSSSIAAYGVQPGDDQIHPVRERQYLTPITMYGINKLYIEQLGQYYSEYYKAEDPAKLVKLDFRCMRFPGLISPYTLPSGGTSDYGPEMIHAAAQGKPYSCFVDRHITIPFMIMADAIKALISLSRADSARLRQRTYNVTSFSVSAEQIAEKTRSYFPRAKIDFNPVAPRQAVVESWPREVDDRPARQDWGWRPDFDFDNAFELLLIPEIRNRYSL